ncbi:MAG: hypothetical protein EBT63_03640 [Proteobacteria bacterium]|nr:hypothetical protein [Pseudomonadota bacterium]NCA28376.1 hypothetical protein [Pseudomonadota bacterium]
MKNYTKHIKKTVFLIALSSSIYSNALAGGYSSYIYSTSGLGNSYSGSSTGSHDVSDSFFNPSITAGSKKNEAIFSMSYLNLKIDPDNITGSNAFGSTNGRDPSNIGSENLIPAFYISSPISNKLSLNFGLTSPFGLKTSYRADWTGKYRSLNSSIKTLNFNPSFAYKISDDLSLGAGLVAQHYEVKLSTLSKHPVFFTDQIAETSGNDMGYGFNLGATFKINQDTKIGVGYRSKIVHNIKGNTELQNVASSRFKSKTSTPESLSIGLSHNLSKDFQLVADSIWTRWSKLQKFSLNAYDNPLFNSSANFNWNDSILNSIGANYNLNEKNLLRFGLAYEKEAMNNRNREPRVPASNKYWLSVGLNHKFDNDLELDLAYVHQFYKTGRININTMGNNNLEGTLNGQYHSSVDVISLAIKKQF